MVVLLLPPTSRIVQLEGPQEVGNSLEVVPRSDNLVDDVLDADDLLVPERGLNDVVIGERSSPLLHLAVPTLVHQVPDRLKVWVPVCDVWLDNPDHVHGGFVHLDEHRVVDLEQPEELQYLTNLRRHGVNTLNADDDSDLGLRGNVEIAPLLGIPLQPNNVPLDLPVLPDILLGPLEYFLPAGFLGLLVLDSLDRLLSRELFGCLALLEERFRDTSDAVESMKSNEMRSVRVGGDAQTESVGTRREVRTRG